jgi:hypothetical protein
LISLLIQIVYPHTRKGEENLPLLFGLGISQQSAIQQSAKTTEQLAGYALAQADFGLLMADSYFCELIADC